MIRKPNFAVPAADVERSEDGKLTFETKDNEAVPLPMLASWVEKPLSWHWVFDGLSVRLSTAGWSNDELVRATATSLGATLIESESEFRFEFNPQGYRKRAISAWQKILNRESGPGGD
ncbi:hypothetical protein, partial [Escherichia coli]|uniref:hypothetical protein n=1 Tax=Escherichia coli TaxID=562 RepID=UPI00312C729A